jgi:hypothetical protein
MKLIGSCFFSSRLSSAFTHLFVQYSWCRVSLVSTNTTHVYLILHQFASSADELFDSHLTMVRISFMYAFLPPLYLEKKCRQAYGTPFPTFRMEGPPPGGCFNLLFRRMSRGCRFLIACRRRSTLFLGSGRFYEIVNCEFYIPYMVL